MELDMKNKWLFFLLLGAILIAIWQLSEVKAEEKLTGKEIIDKVVNRDKPSDSLAKVTMILIDKKDRKRVRTVEFKRKSFEGLEKALIRFYEPADIKGTGFLVWENKGKDNDQFLYLPSLKKIRRITSKQKHESFMGTDFAYEDMSSKEVKEKGKHTLLKSDAVDGFDCYVVETIPSAEEDSQYSKIINWIRKDIFLPVQGEFYDKNGALLKKYKANKIEQIDGYWVITQSVMENVQKGTKTALIVNEVKNNIGLTADDFTERALETY